jgi:hypothetical protein
MKDPTAWMDDLAFYMDDRSVADMAATIEPTLLYARAAGHGWLRGSCGIPQGCSRVWPF